MKFHRLLPFILFTSSFTILESNDCLAQVIKVLTDKNEPAIGAHFIGKESITGKQIIVVSDENGVIDLNNKIKSFPTTFKLSYLGYRMIIDSITSEKNKIYHLKSIPQDLNEVVITGQYGANVVSQSVHTVKVISAQKIALMSAQNLKDVLSNELNIRIGQDNILGSNMKMQGLAGQNVKILIDGVPVLGRLDGNIDLSQINLNNIERIEIVEGPLSVNYGTDALGGAINLISKKGQLDKFNFKNNYYYESNGQYNIDAALGLALNKQQNIQLNGGRYYFDGWNKGDQPFKYIAEQLGDSTRFNSWKPKEQFFGGLNYNLNFNNWKVGVAADLSNEKITNKGYPRAPIGMYSSDDYYKTIRSSNNVNISGKINDQLNLTSIFAYNNYHRVKNSYLKNLTDLSETLSQNDGDQDTTKYHSFMSRSNLFYTFKQLPIKAELGYDVNFETMSGLKILNTKQDLLDAAIFATAEYSPIKQLIIKPGLRYGHNSNYDAPLIPSLNLRYKVALNPDENLEHLTIRASYARGFRAPSLKELYFDFVDINHNIQGNNTLQAEYSNNFILSGVWQKIANQSVYKVEFTSYYNIIDNLIQLAQTDPNATQYTYANIGKFRSMGGTLSTEMAIKHLKFTLGAGIMGLYNEAAEEVNNADKYSFSPEVKANLVYEFKRQNASIAFFYKYTGKLPSYSLDDKNELIQRFTAAYHMTDVTLNKSFYQKKLHLGIGCKNLFDITNLTSTLSTGAHSGGGGSVPLSMGRTYFVKLGIQLKY